MRKLNPGIKRTALAACALISMVTLAACGSSSDAFGPADENAIIKINGAEPARRLTPAAADDTASTKVVDQVFAGLVTYDPKGNVVLDVAKKITPSSDFKTWDIQLHTDRKFHDGTPVKAENFTRAWKQSAKQLAGNTTVYSVIEGTNPDGSGDMTGVSNKGEYEIEIKLKEPIRDFDNRLGINGFYPLPDMAFDEAGNIKDEYGQKPVGNGPYKLEKWAHDQVIELRRADTYVGPREAQNGGVDIVMYAKTQSAYADLLSGQLDVLDLVPDENLTTWKEDLQGRTLPAPTASVQSIDFDYSSPHWSGEEGRLRRLAVSQAINRKEIVEKIFKNTRTPATDFLPPTTFGHTASLPNETNLKFDPKAAKEAWANADAISKWEGPLPIAYNADSNHAVWIAAVVNQLKNNLGVDVQQEAIPTFKEILSRIKAHDFKGGYRFGWTMGYPSAINLLSGRYLPGGNGNKEGYDNPKFNEVLNRANTALTEEDAKKYLFEAQTILAEDLPSVPMFTPNNNIGWSQNVSQVSVTWTGDVALYKVKKH